MADDIPAGWYPDIHGTVRWWDGERWTDHVRDSASMATGPPAPIEDVQPHEPTHAAEPADIASADVTGTNGTATFAANLVDDDHLEDPQLSDEPQLRNPLERYASETATFATPPVETASAGTAVIHRPARTISYPKTVEEEIEEDDGGNRRIWLTATVVGLAALFLGMGIGGRTSVDPPGTTDPIPPAVNADSTDIDKIRQQLEERQAELDERQQVLDDREDELDRRASTTPTPTPTPTATSTATETEIDGNDRVLVGTDVREGTYGTSGPTDPLIECEYSVSDDEFGDDPITEESTKTSASVTLRDGDWFETDDCQDWERE